MILKIYSRLILILLFAPGVAAQQIKLVAPLNQGHSHNDYWRKNPLIDALQLGFKSVEADIFLTNGELLVGHDAKELQPSKNIEAMYLKPLRQHINKRTRLYAKPGSLWLYVDFKTEGHTTYAALKEILKQYQDILVTPHSGQKGHVQVILTGNYPRETVMADPERMVYLDGSLDDLRNPQTAAIIPAVSANWRTYLKWTGAGPIPKAEANALRQWHAQAKQNNQKIRFWNMPETNQTQIEAIWQELLRYDTILIGTDHLDWLKQALTKK